MNPNVKAKKMPNESWKRENKIKGDKEQYCDAMIKLYDVVCSM